MRNIEITPNPQWHPSQRDFAIARRYVFRDMATGDVLANVSGYTLKNDDIEPTSLGLDGRALFKPTVMHLHFQDGTTETVNFQRASPKGAGQVTTP